MRPDRTALIVHELEQELQEAVRACNLPRTNFRRSRIESHRSRHMQEQAAKLAQILEDNAVREAKLLSPAHNSATRPDGIARMKRTVELVGSRACLKPRCYSTSGRGPSSRVT